MRLKNKTLVWFLFSVIIAITAQNMFAQRTVLIQPGFGTFGSTIMGDTTSTGARDTTTVYLLSRGGLYILDGTFSPTFPVHAEATGTGAMPRIIMGLPSGGNPPNQTFQIFNSLYLKGIYLSGQVELGGSVLRIIRVSANDIKVYVDSCQLDVSSQSAFRVESNNVDLRLTNSIVSNIGQMVSPDNGRAIDNRGIPIDSVYIQNCTFYNITSSIYRDGGGTVNNLYYNHNTAVNIGYNGLKIGEAKDVLVSNNIFKNCGFLGQTGSATHIISLSSYPDPTVTQQVVFKNNNFFIDTNIINLYPTLNQTVLAPVTFDSLSLSYVTNSGYASTNINEALNFKKEPSLPLQTIKTFYNTPSATQVDMDTVGQANFDFSYANTYNSYTGSTDGKPLGAVSWFGLMLTGIKGNLTNTIPSKYELNQNYPNPFNPTTNIQYVLPKQGEVSLNIYNILGQMVRSLVNNVQSAGVHLVTWDGANQAGQKVTSGIYFYKLSAGNFVNVKKMIMLK
ncbi:MAG TPA: T9SS type A sorting domain-containing protein [Ignavibacteriaceae bacterium]|nr:T9SS type A sorting domain-containing protein [Ignavibacteriaceae bacterium]